MTCTRFINWRMLSILTVLLAISASAQGAVVLRMHGDGERQALSSEAEGLFAHFDNAERSGASDESANQFDQNELESPFAGGGTSSNTTTSSSSGSSPGSSNASMNHIANAYPDLNFVGWIGGEARFSLPNPPGNELLRPPEA